IKNRDGDECMILLEANQLKKYVKDRLLFDIEHLSIQKNDRIGLVGQNGSGKTTLMEVLAGKQRTEQGSISATATRELLPQLKNKEGDECMILLEANQLKKYVKDRLLFDIEHLSIQKNDRIGLVGQNGSGKTTLMEVLAGKQRTEQGSISATATRELLPQLKN